MPEILPLDKIEAGMSGTAYTVIDGSGVIEPFQVEIIGLMDNGKGSAKMLMAKASGEVIDKVGGVLQGMSGSPVYIDGKLVGALAAGLKEMSPYTFFITPIESMLPMWSMPDPKAINKYRQAAKKTSTILTSKAENKSNENKPNSDAPATKTESTDTKPAISTTDVNLNNPLLFEGLNNDGFTFLSNEFKMNYSAPMGGAERTIKYDAVLEPGSPVGIAVVYGDFSVGATGTVTAVEGKKILGFGHPFTHAGNVNFFMTDAAVIGSISGEIGTGVKVSNIGNIIGRINQDREAGIAGILGTFPSVVPITVKVSDPSLGKVETYNSSIAYNEDLIPRLGASIAYAALSKTADSLAGSTVDVVFKIKTNAVKSGTLERKNIFYNPADVGQVAVIEFMQALGLVCSNTAEESDIFGIDVDMTLDSERRTASIISAIPNKLKVKPGETVNLTVTLQPYRKSAETVVVPYKVPITMKEGPLTLDIHGGAVVSLAQALANAGVMTSADPKEASKSYEEKLMEFVNTGKNNQLVVEIGAVTEPKTEKELKREIARVKKIQEKAAKLAKADKKDDKENQNNENRVETNYIIDNVIHTIIDIDKL
ncbi:MAG: SpoIVB peptidase S55 domain protein [Selenomonadaceae bacterium]|nr:SpoIVB peptidase S55 domain protein [Selenomonadaceae bacterium]